MAVCIRILMLHFSFFSFFFFSFLSSLFFLLLFFLSSPLCQSFFLSLSLCLSLPRRAYKQNQRKMQISRVLISTILFITGIIVSLLQLIAFALLRPFSLRLFRYVNAQIAVLFWLQLVWLAEWWANIDMDIFADDESIAESLLHDHKVILGNHRSDIDWLLGWVVAQKFGSLEGTKALMKASLLRLPGLGLSWWLSDFIFLSRNFERDRKHLNKSATSLQNYPVPLCFMIYAEGTRLTPDKLEQSQQFCRERNLPVLKNVMCPRTKGWVLVMQELRHVVDSVITLTLAFPDVEPGLFTLLSGTSFRVHVYMERFPITQVPGDETASSDWCMQAYQRMDEQLEYHNKHGVFPGIKINRPRSVKARAVMIAWVLILCGGLAWYIMTCSQPWMAALYTLGIVAAVETIIQVGTFFTSKMRKIKKKAVSVVEAVTHADKKSQ
eukprot:m.135279 g.135279  ORF g.135279 m.135279 type:complete len:438 (-) comp15844_c3_seq2:86-1399(-)